MNLVYSLELTRVGRWREVRERDRSEMIPSVIHSEYEFVWITKWISICTLKKGKLVGRQAPTLGEEVGIWWVYFWHFKFEELERHSCHKVDLWYYGSGKIFLEVFVSSLSSLLYLLLALFSILYSIPVWVWHNLFSLYIGTTNSAGLLHTYWHTFWVEYILKNAIFGAKYIY